MDDDGEAKFRERRERLRKFKEEKLRQQQPEEGLVSDNGASHPSSTSIDEAQIGALMVDDDENKLPVDKDENTQQPAKAPQQSNQLAGFNSFAPPGFNPPPELTAQPLSNRPIQLKTSKKSSLKSLKPADLQRKARIFDEDMNAMAETETAQDLMPKRKLKLDFLDDPKAALNAASATSRPVENISGFIQQRNEEAAATDELDQFMEVVQTQVEEIRKQDMERTMPSEESAMPLEPDEEDSDFEVPAVDDDLVSQLVSRLSKRKELPVVDHSKETYEPFRKDFYIESPEISRMTKEQVELYREELEHIKIRGLKCPKPVKKWSQCGLPVQCDHVIKSLGFTGPTPIQAQAIPAIMSGRDMIGVARTGSGKTLAFVLPMLRHIKDQRLVEPGEGPIGLVLTPTRELAMQIAGEARRFSKLMNLRVVCAYGGSSIKEQIGEMKRGAEIVVCTPGRMIDLLCANAGRVTNLKRTSFLVLDEADRMFDMGFEQQVMKIVANIQPNAQRVLFSATFPRQMEALARRILDKPLEVIVGERSVICANVKLHAELLPDEDAKFIRLLDILGRWNNEENDQRMIVFVDRQDAADELLKELFRRGYRCLSLHGGKDQMDRDSTIEDFKSGVFDILIATSVASRGLDVKECNLVVNYDCPSHLEDLVHRCGRTGRGTREGEAYTFVTPEDERYSPILYKGLLASGAAIPPELKQMVDGFMEKVQRGEAKMPSSGFGGKGLERMEKDRERLKMAQKLAHGDEDDFSEEELDMLAARGEEPVGQEGGAVEMEGVVQHAGGAEVADGKPRDVMTAFEHAKLVAARITEMVRMAGGSKEPLDFVAQINLQFYNSGTQAMSSRVSVDVEINDYPQLARYRVSSKESLEQIMDVTRTVIIRRGMWYPPGKQPKQGERKLHLVIEGEAGNVERARNAIRKILSEVASEAGAMGAAGRYSVI